MRHRMPAGRLAMILLAIPFLVLAVVIVLFIMAPTPIGPGGSPSGAAFLLPIAAVLWLIGTGWMIRIATRARREASDGRDPHHGAGATDP